MARDRSEHATQWTCGAARRHLDILFQSPTSLAVGRPKRARQTGAGGCPATLVSTLLNGGCGYEEPASRPLLADERWLRSPLRSDGRQPPVRTGGSLSALQHSTHWR